ncbi:MAG: dihydroxy-acid dehydratase [Desulfatiglandaceae bacterium]
MSAEVKKEAFSSDKPVIGIANSYNNIIPGHVHLNELTAEVKRGIIDAGGIPFEWGGCPASVTVSPCSWKCGSASPAGSTWPEKWTKEKRGRNALDDGLRCMRGRPACRRC